MKSKFETRWMEKSRIFGCQEGNFKFIQYRDSISPVASAPFLNFFLKDEKEQLEFYGRRISSSEYNIIGSDGSGNPICVDLESSKVYLLDHYKDFSPCFVNSSVSLLAEFLLIYMGQRCPVSFESQAKELDPDAILPGSFWYLEMAELEIV